MLFYCINCEKLNQSIIFISEDKQHSREEKKHMAESEMSLDTSNGASSIMPNSQDTGYQTQMEESSQTSPFKQYHQGHTPSVAASTPTHLHGL